MVTWYVFCCPAMTFWIACSGVSGSDELVLAGAQLRSELLAAEPGVGELGDRSPRPPGRGRRRPAADRSPVGWSRPSSRRARRGPGELGDAPVVPPPAGPRLRPRRAPPATPGHRPPASRLVPVRHGAVRVEPSLEDECRGDLVHHRLSAGTRDGRPRCSTRLAAAVVSRSSQYSTGSPSWRATASPKRRASAALGPSVPFMFERKPHHHVLHRVVLGQPPELGEVRAEAASGAAS